MPAPTKTKESRIVRVQIIVDLDVSFDIMLAPVMFGSGYSIFEFFIEKNLYILHNYIKYSYIVGGVIMKLEQLRVLQSVVETGSVKAASERLNKTQPAISQALKAMEFQIGSDLFDRSGYRLELTSLGQRIYLQSLRILTEVDDLSLLVKHFENGHEEKIIIAVDDNIEGDLLIPAFHILQQQYPETRLVLQNEILSGTIKMIKNGSADIAIAPTLQFILEEEGFDYVPISQTKMHNVAAPSLITMMKSANKISDLRQFHQILVSDTGDAKGMFNRDFGVQKGQRRWYVSDLHMKRKLLLEGLGWGRLPSHLIAKDLKTGHLLDIKLQHSHFTLHAECYAFRLSEASNGPVASAIWHNLAALNNIQST